MTWKELTMLWIGLLTWLAKTQLLKRAISMTLLVAISELGRLRICALLILGLVMLVFAQSVEKLRTKKGNAVLPLLKTTRHWVRLMRKMSFMIILSFLDTAVLVPTSHHWEVDLIKVWMITASRKNWLSNSNLIWISLVVSSTFKNK